jgi:hypothetical protein
MRDCRRAERGNKTENFVGVQHGYGWGGRKNKGYLGRFSPDKASTPEIKNQPPDRLIRGDAKIPPPRLMASRFGLELANVRQARHL